MESRIDTLETKLTTSEHGIAEKVATKIAATLPYGAQIAQLEQSIGYIA